MILVYGAYGYTGKLIAHEAKKNQLPIVLGGRREEPLKSLSEETGFPYRAFDLDTPQLEGASVLLNCAGPFSKTAAPLWQACLKNKVHYLDITGEIPVLDSILSQSPRAKEAGIVGMPGVGFDVVPSDCLAAYVAKKISNPTTLELAFYGSGEVSRGTMKTMVEMLPSGGKVRRDGEIQTIPLFSHLQKIPTDRGKVTVVAIPWGDVASAFYSTGIPNIRVYGAAPPNPKALRFLQSPLRAALKIPGVIPFLQNQIENRMSGPSQKTRETAEMNLWARASNANERVEARLKVPEGYHLTALTALESAKRVANGEVPPGSWTPSQAFSPDFILDFPRVTRT